MTRELKPCRSPYCECDVGACTHPGFYDARGTFRVWPDGTVQNVADGDMYDWLSDDCMIIHAADEAHALELFNQKCQSKPRAQT